MGIVIAILILSLIIIIHEFGHFLMGKLFNIQVNEFSIGMGPRILKKQRGETLYSLRLFPIGGMCAFEGEDEENEGERSFQKASLPKRACVVAAGPIFNFALAFICALLVTGFAGADVCSVAEVEKGSPAAEAGLREGDVITRINGWGISNARELSVYITLQGIPKDNISLNIIRQGRPLSISFAPKVEKDYKLGFSYEITDGQVIVREISKDMPLQGTGIREGDIITFVNGERITEEADFAEIIREAVKNGNEVTLGYEREKQEYTVKASPLMTETPSGGFSVNMARQRQGFLGTLKYSIGEIKYCISTTVKSLGALLKGKFGISDLSGPVGVVSTIGGVYKEAKQVGMFSIIMSMLTITILLSANIGVMNLLPLPALDGGRLIFFAIELITGKKVNQKIEGIIHTIGLVALMALAVFVAFSDVFKLLL